jgi:quinone-modifying oxidoreductase subunit QmoA
VRQDTTVRFVKSKPARIALDHATGNPVVHGVDTEGYRRYATPHDLVVLAIGMAPESNCIALPEAVVRDASGFIEDAVDGGQFAAGAAASPLDVNRAVQSAAAAALRAIRVVHRAAAAERAA